MSEYPNLLRHSIIIAHDAKRGEEIGASICSVG
jgi:hypothetical protein